MLYLIYVLLSLYFHRMFQSFHEEWAIGKFANPQGRQVGLYAAECIRIKELDTTAGLWGICSVLLEDTDSDDDDNEELLMVAAVVAAEKSESLRADIQYISESVERKYLRFHSPGLQSSFTQLFRFRAEEMPRLLHCLRMPPWFQLDNGDWKCFANLCWVVQWKDHRKPESLISFPDRMKLELATIAQEIVNAALLTNCLML